MERLYPLLPLQNAIFTDITAALSARKCTLDHHQSFTQNTATWEKFRVLLGKPGTAKSQVLIRAIDHAIRTDMSVLVAAPVAEYAKFLDFIHVLLPIQQQVNEMQRGIVLCPKGQLSDEDIWEAYRQHSDSTIMTVLRKAAQRINDIIIHHLFPGRPISNIPCASVADTNAIFPHKQMQVIFTENQNKAARHKWITGNYSGVRESYHHSLPPRGMSVRLSSDAHGQRRADHSLSLHSCVRADDHQVTGSKHPSPHYLVRLRPSPSRNRLHWPFSSKN